MPVKTPLIGTNVAGAPSRDLPWKKFMAIGMMVIMVATAFAMIVPAVKMPASAPTDDTVDEDKAAHTEIGGPREVTYTFSDIGQSYLKVSDDTARGQLLGASGVNQWWDDRWNIGGYDDYVIRDEAPYVLFYGPYGYNPPAGMVKAGWYMWTFYKVDVVASSLTTIQTGPDEDPILLPILLGGPDPMQYDGGWVDINWYLTYLSDAECTAIDAGSHYANTYYNLPAGMGGLGSGFSGAYANDGWYAEISGTMEFDENAAHKFLGLDLGTGDLTAEFESKNAGNAIGNAWAADWIAEGAANAIYDVNPAYAFPVDPLVVWLSADPTSSADNLVLRMWAHTWGAEVLIQRYLDVTGVLPDWNYIYPEGIWLNATMSPDGSDLTVNGIAQYSLGGGKDMNPNPAIKEAAWVWEPMHTDYMNDSGGLWESKFRLYQPSTTYKPTKIDWMPGTRNFGTAVAYWYAPRNWDLASGETLIIELGNERAWGVKPYKGTQTAVNDKVSVANANTLWSNGVWGELVLGHTIPLELYDLDSGYSTYDPGTKTLTINGAHDFARNTALWPKLNETGTPLIPLAISRVSSYTIELEAQAQYVAGVPYQLTITCLNFTGDAAQGFYNVTLTSDVTGTTFGDGGLHGFLPASNVWVTTVTFGSDMVGGHIFATSGEFPLDVSSELTVTVLIPEFPMLLLPVMGAAVALVVLLRRRNQ